MATKKTTKKNPDAPKSIAEFFDSLKSAPTNGERVVKLAKERDFLCDRIAEAEQEYKATPNAADKKTIAEQLEAMCNYKFHLNIRIKAALDE
jgi:hypothetical protein